MTYLWETHLSGGDAEYDPAYHQKPRSEILPMLEKPPRRFLDVGCGGGTTAALLKSRYPGVFGVGAELNERAAAAAREVLDLVLCGDITDGRLLAASVEPASIDTVLLLDVIEHIYNPWELLKNLHPFLTADAQLVVSIPNVFNAQIFEELGSGHWRYEENGLLDITHIRFFTLRSMYALFEQTGYVVRKKGGVQHPPSMLPNLLKRTPGGLETEHVILRGQSAERLDELFQIQHLFRVSPRSTSSQQTSAPVARPSSRNDPCPCGSGKRYKNCCGSLEGASVKGAIAAPRDLPGLMNAALAKQKAGELSSARELYGQALELAPGNADALHMLGVIAYVEGNLETAERLILEARRACPVEVPMIEGNLALVQGARLQRERMAGFCAASLPNLFHRLHDPSTPLSRGQTTGVCLVVDFSVPGALTNIEGLCTEMARLNLSNPKILTVNDAQTLPATQIVARKLAPEVLPELKESTVLVWGVWETFNHWVERASAGRLMLYCDSDNPERLIAAVNFASVLGERPVELLYSSAPLRQKLSLPGTVLEATSAIPDDPHRLSQAALTRLAKALACAH